MPATFIRKTKPPSDPSETYAIIECKECDIEIKWTYLDDKQYGSILRMVDDHNYIKHGIGD